MWSLEEEDKIDLDAKLFLCSFFDRGNCTILGYIVAFRYVSTLVEESEKEEGMVVGASTRTSEEIKVVPISRIRLTSISISLFHTHTLGK